jgi:hypothetical protein
VETLRFSQGWMPRFCCLLQLNCSVAVLSNGVCLRAGLATKGTNEQGYIPDIEGLTGRAREEAMVKRAFGEDLFDRDATLFLEV